MSVPFQSVLSRRCHGGSLRLAISLAVAFGLAGLYNQNPPIQPMGINPSSGGKSKRCINPQCGRAVRPDQHGRYTCPVCRTRFTAAEADDCA
jgi:hypothetical protein